MPRTAVGWRTPNQLPSRGTAGWYWIGTGDGRRMIEGVEVLAAGDGARCRCCTL